MFMLIVLAFHIGSIDTIYDHILLLIRTSLSSNQSHIE